MGALFVGVALIASWSVLNGAALLLLTIGLPTWLLYLACGEPFYPPSILTHVVALGIAVVGARTMGYPKQSGFAALCLVAGLMTVCRILGPEDRNVNMAFAPWEGLTPWSVTGVGHWVLLLSAWAAGLAVLQVVYGRVYGKVVQACG